MQHVRFLLRLVFLVIVTNAYPKQVSSEAIWYDGESARYVLFRKKVSFASTSKIVEARAHVAAVPSGPQQKLLGAYKFYAGTSPQNPLAIGPGRGDGRTSAYPDGGDLSLCSDEIDLTDALRRSALNPDFVVAMQAYHENGHPDKAGIWIEIDITYESGDTQRVVTDSSFRSFNATDAFGPVASTGKAYQAPQEDAVWSKFPRNWLAVDFDDSFWTPSARSNASSFDVLPLPTKKTRPLVLGRREPTRVLRVGESEYFFDFGTNVMGGLTLETNASTESFVVTLGEELEGDFEHSTTIMSPMRTGNNYTNRWSIDGDAGDTVAGKTAVKRFEHHEYMLFRYATVRVSSNDGGGGLLLNVSAWTVQYPFDDDAASFESNSAALNRVWALCRDTIERTSLDTFTDSNTRERLPYEADGLITGHSRLALTRDVEWVRHSILHNLRNPTWPTEWRQTGALLVLFDYLYNGDEKDSPPIDCFPIDSLLSQTQLGCVNVSTGLVDFSNCSRNDGTFGAENEAILKDIVDWPESARDGFDLTNVNTVVNAYTYGSLRALEEMTGWQNLSIAADGLKRSMNAHLFDDESGLYNDGLDSTHQAWHAQVFPLAFDIPTTETWPRFLDHFRSRRPLMVGSVYAAFWFLKALYRMDTDHGNLAFEVLTSANNRSWIGMINQGASTTMEAWNVVEKPNLSWSHPWASAPASAVVWGLFGIRPTTRGFETVEVKPQPGPLTTAHIKVPTIRGTIFASFEADGDRNFELSLGLPVTIASARVCLPALGNALPSVCVNGNTQPANVSSNGHYACIDNDAQGNITFARFC